MSGNSRRQFLQTLCGGLVVSGLAASLPRRAWASDISLSDRMDLLYGNQFAFDDQGQPRITVGLMQGRREVVLSASGGLQALPSGDGG
ncbi:MAG: twin-arginine translocation signal domain-containing protein, partial [Myxococcales bacterium]|nr:twin-arginine translocation signal domain-containing protein [Myxococcales bacterium]